MSGVTGLGGALRYSGFRVEGLGLGDSSPILGYLDPTYGKRHAVNGTPGTIKTEQKQGKQKSQPPKGLGPLIPVTDNLIAITP